MNTILPALISAVGTLCGALGGIALTGGLESRRQRRQVADSALREQSAALKQARNDLVTAISELRVEVEMACARHWKDMNLRLDSIQQKAVAAGVQASLVAMLVPDPDPEAAAALALGACASSLAAWAAKRVTLGDFAAPDRQAGQIVGQPDFTELENRKAAFLRLVSPAAPAVDLPPPRLAAPVGDAVSRSVP